ncbi:MAG: nitroreductase family protein [Planctomycetes bacterium]|nr:nitroreductase family protein [Planctomycetota bacterium]
MDDDPIRRTELDATLLPELRERIAAFERAGVEHAPRSYVGLPTWPLPHPGWRPGPSLDRVLARRRSRRALGTALPSPRALARVLQAHAVTGGAGRGPTPSAGDLQALELYAVALDPAGWLPPGCYHFDRPGHHLSQVVAGDDRSLWRGWSPSLDQFQGGCLLWVLVGDVARVRPKYGERALRLLLLEAGHLMQGLCLASEAVGLTTLPLGGVCEARAARRLRLPPDDAVLYAGALG